MKIALQEAIEKLENDLQAVRLENKKLHRDVYILNRDLANANAFAATSLSKLSKRTQMAILRRAKNIIKRIPLAKECALFLKSKMKKAAPVKPPLIQLIKQDQAMQPKANPKHLVFISPLPPAKSGIADYSMALLEELKAFYTITIVCEDETMLTCKALKEFSTITAKEYYEQGNASDRHLYHFGNSFHHLWMEPLLERYAGIIVLHDVFLGGYTHAKLRDKGVTAIVREVFNEEGYAAVKTYMQTDLPQTLFHYPMHKNLLSKADGVIVHSDYARALIKGDVCVEKVPFPKAMSNTAMTKAEAKERLGFSIDTFLVCTFGFIGPTKCSQALIKAWQQSILHKDVTCKLVFVGSLPQTDYGDSLTKLSQKARITFTGYCEEDMYQAYLVAADIVVQLRQNTRGESSAALFDALSYGKPTIINTNGSFNEIPSNVAHHIPDSFTLKELSSALEIVHATPTLREELSQASLRYIQMTHNPHKSATRYSQSIEQLFQKGRYGVYRQMLTHATMEELQEARTPSYQKNLFIDVSDVANNDLRTGIQRVVRSIVRYLMEDKELTYTIKPVRFENGHYKHAHAFTCKFLNLPFSPLEDEIALMEKDDIFLGLDLYVGHIGAHPQTFSQMQQKGVQIWFVIYDILPILFPHFFPPQTAPQFHKWLEVVTMYAYGVACISNAVAQDVTTWINQTQNQRERPLHVKSFALGSDIDNTHPTKGIDSEQERILATLSNRAFALMVGTIEPRKGHKYMLDAFDILWEKEDLSLVIVGKQGWMVEDTISQITQHPFFQKKLFWFEKASDEMLEKLYTKATCLIAASQGEGFGLPLIEAAHYGLPIIARDIPVFKEVGKSSAYYFSNTQESSILAEEMTQWLHLYKQKIHPQSTSLKCTTWEVSTQEIASLLKLKNQTKSFQDASFI